MLQKLTIRADRPYIALPGFLNIARHVALPFLVSRVLILVVACYLQWMLDSGAAYKYGYIGEAPLSTLSANFDANWYGQIATSGYSLSPDVTIQQNYHFFPLYPFLTWLASDLSGTALLDGGYNLMGVVLSHVFFFLALVLLYRLTYEVWGDSHVATRAVWLMSALPWAFVFSMAYTEALFLLLSLAAISVAYSIRTYPRLHLTVAASLLATLAALTRPQGLLVALFVAALVSLVPRGLGLTRRAGHALIAGVPAVIAVFGFIFYVSARTGNPLAVFQVNRTWGEGWLPDMPRLLILPPANPVWYVDAVTTVGLVVWVLLLLLAVKQLKRQAIQEPTAWLFTAYSCAYFLFTALNSPSNSSWGRYMLVVFPCIWALASWIRPSIFNRAIIVSLALQGMLLGAAVLQQVTP